ncbi:MAG: hypothetical protein ABEI13_01635, partial [Candidatus Paceibacteria bacterium]
KRFIPTSNIQKSTLFLLIFAASVVLFTAPAIYEFITSRRISGDSAFFLHSGWQISSGRIPYLEIWDIKPPLAHWLPVVYSILFGGNPTYLHLAGVVTTVFAAALIITCVSIITYYFTDD